MAGFTKEHQRIIQYVEPQGVTVTRTTKGLLFRMPNGETEMLHYTLSDWRSTRNFRANLRRNGVEYPGDYEARGKKKGKPYQSSIELVKEALSNLNPETVKTTDLIKYVNNVMEKPMNTHTAVRVMIHLGYWHDYKKPKSTASFVWHPPVDPKEIIEPLEDMENLVQYADTTDDETVTSSKEVNVSPSQEMDVHTDNSWSVQLDNLDGSITLDQLRIVYMAAGFHLDVRVWR